MDEKEQYFGSVRFFRHLILCFICALIVIPVLISVCLGIYNRNIHRQYEKLLAENEQLNEELQIKGEELELYHQMHTMKNDDAVAEEDGWELLLVNDTHPLDPGFTVELSPMSGIQKVDSRIQEPLEQMLDKMKKEGMKPMICSSYRSLERQSQLFYEYIEEKLEAGWNYENAFYKAKRRIAAPGTSEHQTGLAVDIVGKSHQSLDDAQAGTKEAIWLKAHCAEYGFILRYPEDKTEITGKDYESWHFRYVGEKVARYIMEHGITLEEYLDEFAQ